MQTQSTTTNTAATENEPKLYATCRSPRAEILKTGEGLYFVEVKLDGKYWHRHFSTTDEKAAVSSCCGYIDWTSKGRVDPHKALKIIQQ